MRSAILQFFNFDHLKGQPRDIKEHVAQLAEWMEAELPANPEKSAGLRHLLEASDCFVRSAFYKDASQVAELPISEK